MTSLAPTAPLPQSYDALVADIAALLEVDRGQLAADASLLDWGLDSIRLMSLVERCRQTGVDVTFVELAEDPTLRHLARRLGVVCPET